MGAIALLSLAFTVFQYFAFTKENSVLNRQLEIKTSKVQELELELTPFRTLAIDKFSKADPQTLRQLAAQMTALQSDYSNALDEIEQLRNTNKVTQLTLAGMQADHSNALKTVEQLRKSAEKSQLTLAKMQRRIPPDKKDDCVMVLSKLPKAQIQIMCVSQTGEAILFSEELNELESGGFHAASSSVSVSR